MRKSNYEKAIDMAYKYGDKRVKRFADNLMLSFEDKMYSRDEIYNCIQSVMLIDALKTLTEQQSDVSPNNLIDSDV